MALTNSMPLTISELSTAQRINAIAYEIGSDLFINLLPRQFSLRNNGERLQSIDQIEEIDITKAILEIGRCLAHLTLS